MDMMILAQQSGKAVQDQARRNYWRMSLMEINLFAQRAWGNGHVQIAWQRGIDPGRYAWRF
jgi:hypothetical protein